MFLLQLLLCLALYADPTVLVDGKVYDVGEELGKGGEGQVFSLESEDGKVFAGKVFDERRMETGPRYKANVKAQVRSGRVMMAVGTRHPNVVKVEYSGRATWINEDGTSRERPIIVMERLRPLDGLRPMFEVTNPIEGFGSFETKMKRNLVLLSDLFAAIEWMDRFSMFHGDLKEYNLGLDLSRGSFMTDYHTGGIPTKVIDFGPEGTATVGYRAPEVVKDLRKSHSLAADLYSAVVTVYTMMVGQPPVANYMDHLSLTNDEFVVGIEDEATFERELAGASEERWRDFVDFAVDRLISLPSQNVSGSEGIVDIGFFGEVVRRALARNPEHRVEGLLALEELSLSLDAEGKFVSRFKPAAPCGVAAAVGS